MLHGMYYLTRIGGDIQRTVLVPSKKLARKPQCLEEVQLKGHTNQFIEASIIFKDMSDVAMNFDDSTTVSDVTLAKMVP